DVAVGGGPWTDAVGGVGDGRRAAIISETVPRRHRVRHGGHGSGESRGGIIATGILTLPHGPEPVGIAMNQKEEWVLRRRAQRTDVAGVAADEDVRAIMGGGFVLNAGSGKRCLPDDGSIRSRGGRGRRETGARSPAHAGRREGAEGQADRPGK